jgi:hypothetical protein
MRTLNEHIKLFESFRNQHGQIRSFGFGDPWEQQETDEETSTLNYPLMFVVLDGANVSGNELTNTYTIGFFDKVKKGETNELETLSDCQLLALDFVAWLDDSNNLWDDHNIEIDNDLQDYTEHTSDWIAGWTITVKLRQAYTRNACDIPLIGN